MQHKGYAEVKVKVVGDKVVCDPDPVECYFLTGPDNIRWTFKNLPKKVASVVIEWKGHNMHRGMGHAASTVGSHLQDIITSGNTCVVGRFFYNIYCLDAKGNEIAYADPESGNSGQPPN